ncbi:MAG: electron transfer flavoprotein subunit beta/FixA family protein [Planctomycetes bacterium]|nr:electron transfer flavoprotein subunit beta/FixA family protein [Planctomycetota bacterium]
MKILAITNAVPDPRGTLTTGDLNINSGGVKWAINPYDEYAVEQAVQLKEQRDDVDEVIVIAVGGDEAVTALRHAMAMGADRGIHIVCNDVWHDDLYVAKCIADAIETSGDTFDLLLCGKTNLSRDSESMGPALAEFLDIPHVGSVITLVVGDESATATHRVAGANETVEVKLPALVMCDKTLVDPRYPPLPKVMQARKKPLETIEPTTITSKTAVIEFNSPPEKGACTVIEGSPEEMASELLRVLREEAKVL